MSGTLRLHQICLVAYQLEPVEDEISDVLQIEPCHHSDLFGGKFGIHNVVYEIGGSFLEVVGLHPGVDPKTSPAGRYLARRQGNGGYMVILECNDVERRRALMDELGVRIVLSPNHDGFNEIQLHPADTGGSLISLNETKGRDGLVGNYLPAGADWWKKARRSICTLELVAAEVQGPDPEGLACRWSTLLERPVSYRQAGLPEIVLDLGIIRFVPDRDGRGEGLGGFDVIVADRSAVLARAKERGARVDGDVVHLCGTRIRLIAP